LREAYMVVHPAAMNLRSLRCFAAASLFLSLAGLAGCTADTSIDSSGDGEDEVGASEDAVTGGVSNFGYYLVTRQDFRKCASPMCGGLFVKRVNAATTQCADGSKQAECYVSAIQLTGIGLSAREEADFRGKVTSGKALVKARLYKKSFNGTSFGTLKANEGWLGATGSAPDGTFYRVGDNGIRCIKAPCPSTTAAELNGHEQHNVVKVNLASTAVPASQESLDSAAQALGTKEGILLAGGIALPKCVPGSDCGPFASASELYLRVTAREGKPCGFWGTFSCNAGQYCNWKAEDICGAADASGTCAYRPEICYQLFKPVCACDGKTYSNSCVAAAAGASVSSDGPCEPSPKN
jgi:hypothetical protein